MGYENYIDTGEFWIKVIPASWEIKRLKSRFTFGKGLPITKADLTEVGTPVISYGQVHAKYNTGTGLSDSLFRFVPESFLVSHPQCLVHKNDFIVADTSEDRTGCGNCAFVDREIPLFAGYHSIILRNRGNEDNKYLAYLFLTDAWRSQIRARVDGVKLFSISKAILGSANIILPPREEQDQIVRYLDWQLSKINKLIHGYQRQIKLLEERKTAITNDAVTKGLKPDVEYKSVESNWTGDIPAHWDFGAIKQHFQIQKRIAGKEGYAVLSITQQGLKIKDVASNEGQIAASYANYQFVYPGDFAMNHMDLLTGYVGLSEYFGVTSPDYRVFTITDTDNCNPEYYLYVFQLCYKRRIFYGLGKGAASKGRWRMPAINFKNFGIPIPPMNEQIEIVAFIKEQEKKISELIAGIEKSIEALKEYRTRLISDVVTGQMDVRGIEIPDYTPEEDISETDEEENEETEVDADAESDE